MLNMHICIYVRCMHNIHNMQNMTLHGWAQNWISRIGPKTQITQRS